jgi:PepSY-associated TM region
MLRKNIYKWHRTLSLVIAVPVLLWASSGLMHPIMTSFKPDVKNQSLPPVIIDTNAVAVTLKEALEINGIQQIQNFRIVKLDGRFCYQVQLNDQPELEYFSCADGEKVNSGDVQYAQQLATAFLGDSAASITNVTLLTSFTDQYRDINRLLPVYKITFNRSDGIILYIDNFGDRFGLATDNFRNGFQKFFTYVHTWEWLSFLGNGKLVVEMAFAILAFVTALMGLYIFFITNKPKSNNGVAKQRRRHRVTSLVAVTFTLLFTFSGAYHAFKKFEPDTRQNYSVTTSVVSSNLDLDIRKIETALGDKSAINGISLVSIDREAYWRVLQTDFESRQVKEECCHKPATRIAAEGATMPGKKATTYIRVMDNSILNNGELIYARFLANTFSGNVNADVVSTDYVSKFTEEYGFINKRLPVVKVGYDKNDNERYYVETATGKLSVKVQDSDLYEGYSFALLHKHHFMDWAGKTSRDVTTMLGALLNIAAVVVGLILYIRIQRRKKPGQRSA